MTKEQKREALASFMVRGYIPREPDPDGYLAIDGVLVNSETDPVVQQAYGSAVRRSMSQAFRIEDVEKRMKLLMDLHKNNVPIRQRRYNKKSTDPVVTSSPVTPTSPSTDYLKPEPVAEEKSAVDRVRENLEE